MSGHVLKIRRDTAAVLTAVTPALGEPFMNTTTGDMGLGDGAHLATDPAVLFSKQTHTHNASVINVTAAGLMQKNKVDTALAALFGLCPKVLSRVTAAPPGSPSIGDNYIIPASGASGEWVSKGGQIATCSAITPSVVWSFTVPAAGQYVISDEDQKLFRYNGTAWIAAGTTSFMQSAISPAQLVANTNDYAPSNLSIAQVIRLSADVARNLTGLSGGSDGRVIVLQMLSGSGALTLTDEDVNSVAANRFSLGSSIKLKAMEQARLRYDGTLSRWVLLSRTYIVLDDLPGSIAFSGVVSDAPSASQNDYAPTGAALAATFLVSPSAALNITGLGGGRNGREVTIFNMAAYTLTLKDASSSSVAANRFSFGADVPLSQFQSATLRYDVNSSRWLLQASTAGVQVSDGAVGPAKLSTDALGLRAKIVAASFAAMASSVIATNPFFSVSQENGGTTLTSIGSTGGVETYIVDGWKVRAKGSLRVSAQQISAGLPGMKSAVRLTVTTTQSSLGTGDYLQLRQSIVGSSCARLGFGAAGANPLALGLYLRASISGTFSVELSNSAGDRSIVKTVTLTANTWTFVSFAGAPGSGLTAFPGDTSGTWLTDNGVGLSLSLTMAAGSSLQGSADAWVGAEIMTTAAQTNLAATLSATFDVAMAAPLAGTEMCDASNAPYMARLPSRELELCQETWRPVQGAGGVCYGAGAVIMALCWIGMRSTPTILPNGIIAVFDGVTNRSQSSASVALNIGNANGGNVTFANFSGLTSTLPAIVTGSNYDVCVASARF